MMWSAWWIWVAGGLALAILELLAPGYIFVGFAIGAVVTGAAMGLGLPGSAWLAASPANAFFAFALLSVLAWAGLRLSLGVRKGQVKRFDRDINED